MVLCLGDREIHSRHHHSHTLTPLVVHRTPGPLPLLGLHWHLLGFAPLAGTQINPRDPACAGRHAVCLYPSYPFSCCPTAVCCCRGVALCVDCSTHLHLPSIPLDRPPAHPFEKRTTTIPPRVSTTLPRFFLRPRP
ncbi:hypothetical protein VTJ04DRAFT_194 [Mycothermus thermophilus]|uniref:uncharacterized protein n=1 Tax=Humicola insolens TaxID=85995 RepID=UPI003742E265